MRLNCLASTTLPSAALLLLIAGCASRMPTANGGDAGSATAAPAPAAPNFAPAVQDADVPAAVRPPLGQSLFLEALASGVQIYECTSSLAGVGWVLKGPEATLVDRAGRPLGKHHAGPTWESVDGSSVVGEVRSTHPGPDPKAVPWLLLSVKSTAGSGVLTQTKSIQRLSTSGGIAPGQPCDSSRIGEIARVPYQATYNFYRVAR